MKIEKVKILGLNFDIIESKDHSSDDTRMGTCETKTNKIYIKESLNDDTKLSTILHEVLHAIGDKLGLEIPENAVCCLESGLFSFMKDNKEFIKQITD